VPAHSGQGVFFLHGGMIMAATKAMIEYAKVIAEELALNEPDFASYSETSQFISDNVEEYRRITRQHRTIEALEKRYGEIDLKISQEFQTLLESLQGKHGVYMFTDDTNSVVYVGKSINLQERVFSSLKERIQESDITDVIIIHTPTIADMHLLEIYLIICNKPVLNKDCKSDDFPELFTIDKEKIHMKRYKIFD
jgi:hypothetical protein